MSRTPSQPPGSPVALQLAAPPLVRPRNALEARRGRRRAITTFLRNPLVLGSVVILGLMVVLALGAPLFQMHDPLTTNLRARQAAPSLEHLLGTDALGRDVWSRIVWGARTSLPVGIIVVAISLAIGATLGVAAAYFGGKIDALVSSVVNLLLSLPGLLLAIALVAALGAGIWQVMFAIGIGQAPRFARLQRSVVLGIRERDYVLAARAIGAGHTRIIWSHVVPNSVAPLIVLASLTSAHAIVVEASLSFLGLGIPPPMPSWGGMLSEGRTILRSAPWVAVFPGLMIMLVTLALNILGDALRDATDPRLKGRGSASDKF